MARDGYITDREYRIAEEQYRVWVKEQAVSLSMYMLTAEGVRLR